MPWSVLTISFPSESKRQLSSIGTDFRIHPLLGSFPYYFFFNPLLHSPPVIPWNHFQINYILPNSSESTSGGTQTKAQKNVYRHNLQTAGE